MLAVHNRQLNSIFERIVKDKNGVIVRIRFTVVSIDGKFQGQIISATPLVSRIANEDVICLPCLKDKRDVIEDSLSAFIPSLSPYFSLEFFMSQPTRAPANR